MKDLRNYPLLAHNTFGMDVRASRFVEYASEEELRSFLMQPREEVPLLAMAGVICFSCTISKALSCIRLSGGFV